MELQSQGDNDKKTEKKNHFGKKGKLIAGVLFGAVVIIGIGLGVVFYTGNNEKDYTNQLLYVQNDKLYMVDGKKKDAIQISEKLMDKDKEDYDSDFYDTNLPDSITIYQDEECIIYPANVTYVDNSEDNYDEEDDDDDYDEEDDEEDEEDWYDGTYSGYEYSLYWRSLKDTDEEPVKIDSNVQGSYIVKQYGSYKRIFYIKNSALYCYDFGYEQGEKQKIGANVINYEVSDEGDKLVGLFQDGLFYIEEGKDEQKLSNTVYQNSEYYVSSDFSEVYYVTADLELYQTKVTGEKNKIADNITKEDGLIEIDDTGKLYYSVTKDTEIRLWDYITDDVSTGEELVEPEEPADLEYSGELEEDGETAMEYLEKLEKWQAAYDEYLEAYEVYEKAVEWNDNVAQLQQTVFTIPVTTFYYYDGTESTELGHLTNQTEGEVLDEDENVVVLSVSDDSGLPNFKLSEYNLSNYTSVDDFAQQMNDDVINTMMSDEDIYDELSDGGVSADFLIEIFKQNCYLGKNVLVVDGVIQDVEGLDIGSDFYVTSSCITYMDEDKLMQLDIKDGKAQAPVTYDTDVASYRYFDDDIFYFKNYDEENYVGDLYKNKEKIDDEVVAYGIIVGSHFVSGLCSIVSMENLEMFDSICIKEDKVYYFKDRDSEPFVTYDENVDTKANTASLMVYGNGKAELVASDVNALDQYESDNKLYYETNYDENDMTSTVYCIENDESVKVLDDVYDFFVMNDGTCYYMANYDDKYETGDLYFHGAKDNTLIATDVKKVIEPNEISIHD